MVGSNLSMLLNQGNRIARNDNGSVIRYVLDRGGSMSHVLCETDDSGNIIVMLQSELDIS